MKTLQLKNALLMACAALLFTTMSCDDDPGVENYGKYIPARPS